MKESCKKSGALWATSKCHQKAATIQRRKAWMFGDDIRWVFHKRGSGIKLAGGIPWEGNQWCQYCHWVNCQPLIECRHEYKRINLPALLYYCAFSLNTTCYLDMCDANLVLRYTGWFLSPSGDLGISLVWHNLSPPPQLFGPTVEILFKLN